MTASTHHTAPTPPTPPVRQGAPRDDRLAARIKSLIRAVPDFPIPGIRFRDVMGLVEDPDGFRAATAALAGRFRGAAPEVVVGIEARGFIFGVPVAQELGVGFVAVRKAGKLPGKSGVWTTTWSTGARGWRCRQLPRSAPGRVCC